MTPMNARLFHEARPRLICRAVRQWHALFPEHRLSHLSTCPSCQSCLEASRTIELSLRQDALQRREEVGETGTLERDILRAVRVAGTRPEHARSRPAHRAWTLGGLGAIAAIVALMAGLGREPVTEQRGSVAGPAPIAPTEEVAVIIETVDSLSTEFVDSVLPTAGGLVANNPLQQEFTSVYSDMRSALDFLALNFLPTAPVNAKATPSRQI
jgi:hypothetical protein